MQGRRQMVRCTRDICRSSSSANGALLVDSKLSVMGRSSCAAALAAVICAGRVSLDSAGVGAGDGWGTTADRSAPADCIGSPHAAAVGSPLWKGVQSSWVQDL